MYDKVRRELISLADTKYKTFSLRLMPGVEEKRFLGVRTPLLRKIAKLMVKEGVWLEYMESNKNEYFEEIMLEGMIVGIVKIDLRTRFDYMKNFMEKIDNWAICDMFCSGLSFKDEEKDELWNFLLGYNRSKSEFNVRFLAVMLKKFYMIKSYIKAVLDVLSKIRCDGYYAKMGIAWTVAEAYIKFPDITTRYLDNYNFDKFTHKMVLQKIRESLRQPKQC